MRIPKGPVKPPDQEAFMVDFKDFLPREMDRTIQNALREVDVTILSTAMVGMEEEYQELFRRNMSKRAVRLLDQDIEAQREAPQHGIEKARTHLKQLLRKHAKYADRAEPIPEEGELPEVILEDEEQIIATFRALAAYVGRHGFLPLEDLEGAITHPIMKKGVEFLVDGWDALVMRELLSRRRDAILSQMRRRLDMMLDGLESLASRELPQVTEERLRAFLPDN
jgi:hypothetical protein